METRTLIEPTANVVRIVSLRQGDVYKRLDKLSYSETHEIKFGIVQSVMHNGTDAALTAIEFSAGYNAVSHELKVFANGNDLALFAATPAEIETHFGDLVESSGRKVRDAEKALTAAQQGDVALRAAIDAARFDGLTSAAVDAITAH